MLNEKKEVHVRAERVDLVLTILSLTAVLAVLIAGAVYSL
jgi:hypothetical protein